jgi:hypothetical protein
MPAFLVIDAAGTAPQIKQHLSLTLGGFLSWGTHSLPAALKDGVSSVQSEFYMRYCLGLRIFFC